MMELASNCPPCGGVATGGLAVVTWYSQWVWPLIEWEVIDMKCVLWNRAQVRGERSVL